MALEKLTVRITPYPGESLFSFLLRLSESNGIHFLSLWNMVKKPRKHYVQMSDIGILNFAPVNVIDPTKLAEKANLDIEKVYIMSCYFILKRFHKNRVEGARFMSGMLREDYYFCPTCLSEEPSHKLIWSVNGIDVCLKHGVTLTNKCPVCHHKISLTDIERLVTCPYCHSKLSSNAQDYSADYYLTNNSHVKQQWIEQALNYLNQPCNFTLKPEEIALRVIYILNKFKPEIDRKIIINSLEEDHHVLPRLLQHARGSLTQKRILNLSFLLSILYKNGISISEFYSIKIPSSFVKSVSDKPNSKWESVSCLAPWCKNHGEKGSLIKTHTSFKRNKKDEYLKYYLICPECGCEYGFNENDNLVERTYFIKGFNALKECSSKETLREMAMLTELTVDKLKRCIAYFNVRAMFLNYSQENFKMKEEIVQKVAEAIKANTKIKTIESWDIWQSYRHFLYYRFHPTIIKTIQARPYDISKRAERNILAKKRDLIQETVDTLRSKNVSITIQNVCRVINICPETLRNWGGNFIISQAKKEQRRDRIKSFKNDIYVKSRSFFKEKQGVLISSEELYTFLGVRRSVLWRNAPEITSNLYVQVIEHNKHLVLKT